MFDVQFFSLSQPPEVPYDELSTWHADTRLHGRSHFIAAKARNLTPETYFLLY